MEKIENERMFLSFFAFASFLFLLFFFLLLLFFISENCLVLSAWKHYQRVKSLTPFSSVRWLKYCLRIFTFSLCVKKMRSRIFQYMNLLQIWYKDSFRVSDVNFNKRSGGHRVRLVTIVTRISWFILAQHFSFLWP